MSSVKGKPGKSTSSSSPLFGAGTQYSRVETVGGGGKDDFFSRLRSPGGDKRVILDPSIRGLQEEGIASGAAGQRTLGEAVGRFGGSLGELKSRLFTNQDPYMRARTAATEERFAGERGALQRDIGRRGIAGSSFGQQAQTSQAASQERTLADQRALATQESISAGVSIDELVLQAEQAEASGNLAQANLLRGVAQDRAQIETDLLTATTSQSSQTGGTPGLLQTGIGLAGAAGSLGARPLAPTGGGGGTA